MPSNASRMQPHGLPGNPKPRFRARWIGSFHARTVVPGVYPMSRDPGGFLVAASIRMIGVVEYS